MKRSKLRRQLSRRPSTQNIALPKNRYDGSIKKPSAVKFTFTTQHAGTASGGLSAHMLTDTTPKRGLCTNTTVATGTDAENVTRTIATKLLTTTIKHFATLKRTKTLRKAGYRVIEAWGCEVGEIDVVLPRPQMQSYPHTIFYEFEAYGDKNQRKEPTGMLTIENTHVPISVSVGDTLERESTHICEKDPAELVRKFMEELERRGKNIRIKVRARRRKDASKSAGPQNRRMVRSGASSRVQLRALRSEPDQRTFRRAPI